MFSFNGLQDSSIKILLATNWEADSRIADGLYNTLEHLQDQQVNLLFITDGHEAPPANPRYREPLEPFQGLDPKGELLYATNDDDNQLSVIDIAKHKVVKRIPVGAEPEGFR